MPKFHLVLIMFLLSFAGCNSPIFVIEPFEAHVVDAETGEPIEGAVVVANWALYEDTFLGGERFREQMEVKETQTDTNGRFAFAGFTKTNPRLLKLRGENSRVTIFKSGYEYSTWANSCPADGFTCPTIKHLAKVAGHTVKLKRRLDSHRKLDRAYAPYFGLSTALDNILDSCNSHKIPQMLEALTAEHGLMLVSTDTSPRNTGIEGATKDWDFGEGASFYLDATEGPWRAHFQMESWVAVELRELICARFPARADRIEIFGHSMGGHGALTLAIRYPQIFRSVSAFAPISAPTQCAWGEKAFSNYLGHDRQMWNEHDASELIRQRGAQFTNGILIDQGLSDKFYAERQLQPEVFEAACAKAGQPLTLRRHAGYDHGYYFISTFIADHLAFHRANLSG